MVPERRLRAARNSPNILRCVSVEDFSEAPRGYPAAHRHPPRDRLPFPPPPAPPPSANEFRITRNLRRRSTHSYVRSRAVRVIFSLVCLHRVRQNIFFRMEVAKANDTAGSLVEQSLNVQSAMKSVKTSQSTQKVESKSVVESSTSIKSVTMSSSKSHRSLEYEESVEYTDE